MIDRLRTDPGYREAVETAREWSVPLSVMRGRVITKGEGEWTAKDRQAAVALHRIESMTHKCGQRIDEAFDEDLAGLWESTPMVCYACAAQEYAIKDKREEAEMYKPPRPQIMFGMQFPVTRKDSGNEHQAADE